MTAGGSLRYTDDGFGSVFCALRVGMRRAPQHDGISTESRSVLSYDFRLKKNQRILLSGALVLLGCVLLIVSIVSFDAEYELGDSVLMVCSRFGVLAVCVALAVLLLRPKMKPEHMLLLLGIPLGLCYMLMVAPFSAPDEHAHYLAILAHVCPLIKAAWWRTAITLTPLVWCPTSTRWKASRR